MTRITTHVLDTSAGRPAAGIAITLEMHSGSGWEPVASATTDRDGRAPALGEKTDHPAGTYRLRFGISEYFAANQVSAFYPSVEVTFMVKAGEHYHLPLLVSPFGYSTYRGS